MSENSCILLKARATHFLNVATANLHMALRHAVAFEKSSTESKRIVHAQHAAYRQIMALEADEAARALQIESDEMHKFMHSFFATNVDWNQI